MAQEFRTNITKVAFEYIKALKVNVTKTTFKQTIEQEPYFPSLYSLSNTFDKFNIENVAFNATHENLQELDLPFVAYCSGQSTGKDFVLVTRITDTKVTYIAEKNKPTEITKEQFLKKWEKVAFVAKANDRSGEKSYDLNLRLEKAQIRKQQFLYLGVAVLISFLIYKTLRNIDTRNIITATSIILIKILGLAITMLLLIYEIDKTNSFVKNICTTGKQTNCDAVLNSKASKFLGMSWGEIGFFYFASTTLLLLFPGMIFPDKLNWLALTSTIAAPYVLFSVYYQWKIVKQWCPLCLSVQLVLMLELIWSIANFWISLPFSSFEAAAASLINTLWILIFSAFLPIVIWCILKPILISAKSTSDYKLAYKRILYNPEVFKGLLQQQVTAPEGWAQLGITIGNPNARNTIIKVCNPYCGPCANAHPVLEEIVKHNKDINVKVIFTATNKENDRANKPVKHLLAIAAKGDPQVTEQALDDWYMADKKDYEAFAIKYPMNGELKVQESKIEMMNKWCEDAEIMATPTIFINGKKLPETYNINELKNIF